MNDATDFIRSGICIAIDLCEKIRKIRFLMQQCFGGHWSLADKFLTNERESNHWVSLQV